MVNVVNEVAKLVDSLVVEQANHSMLIHRHGELQKVLETERTRRHKAENSEAEAKAEVERLIQRNAKLQVDLQTAECDRMSALKAELEGERRLRLDAQNLAHNLAYANDGLKKQCERLKTDHRAVSSPQGGSVGLAAALDTVRRERNGLVEKLAKEERTALNRLNSINVLEWKADALARENADLKNANKILRLRDEGVESIIQKLKRERGEAELRAFEAKQENERLKMACKDWDECVQNQKERIRLAEAQRNNLRDLCDTVLAENKKLRDEAGFNEMPF